MRKRPTTRTPPTSPNSSPTTAKMKSLKALGTTTPPACVLWPRPAPKIAAEAQGQQPLDGVEAGAERILPGVQERGDAARLVGVVQDHHGHPGDARRQQQGELPQVGAGDPEEDEGGQGQHAGRAQVGLLDDQEDDRRDQQQERDGAVPDAADALAAVGHPVGQVDDQRQLGQLGRVDRRQRADLQPAGRAADLDAEAGHAGRSSRRPMATA